MRVDVYSDLVCPWCYLGKRRLERALAAFPSRDRVEVVYRSFQLDPAMPRWTTVPQAEVLARKYGLSPERARELQTEMEARAAADGLTFRLAGASTGNTLDAHRVVHLARARGLQEAVVERLFAAHFTERRSLFDPDSLAALAVEAGLPAAETRAVVGSDDHADAVATDLAEARRLGVRGVPFYVLGGRLGVSGAQPPEVLADALAQAWEVAGG